MREIKFKAKRLDNGEWCEGYFYEEMVTHISSRIVRKKVC